MIAFRYDTLGIFHKGRAFAVLDSKEGWLTKDGVFRERDD